MARATTTPQSLMSVKRFASIWNVASSRMALQGRGVMTVGTTTFWPIPAKFGASALCCQARHSQMTLLWL